MVDLNDVQRGDVLYYDLDDHVASVKVLGVGSFTAFTSKERSIKVRYVGGKNRDICYPDPENLYKDCSEALQSVLNRITARILKLQNLAEKIKEQLERL